MVESKKPEEVLYMGPIQSFYEEISTAKSLCQSPTVLTKFLSRAVCLNRARTVLTGVWLRNQSISTHSKRSKLETGKMIRIMYRGYREDNNCNWLHHQGGRAMLKAERASLAYCWISRLRCASLEMTLGWVVIKGSASRMGRGIQKSAITGFLDCAALRSR